MHRSARSSFVTASRAAQAYEYYELNKNGPLFEFNIVVQGAPEADRVVLTSRLHGHLSDEENAWQDFSTRLVVDVPNQKPGARLLSEPWTTQQFRLRSAARGSQ